MAHHCRNVFANDTARHELKAARVVSRGLWVHDAAVVEDGGASAEGGRQPAPALVSV